MTLTELSYYSRRFLPFGIICFIVLLIFYYAITLFFVFLDSSKPHTVFIDPVFGKIKQPTIQNVISAKPSGYILDTIEGQPVTATESAKVFFIPDAKARINFRQKINAMATTLGIDVTSADYILEGEKDAHFRQASQEAIIDITNFNFSYQYSIRDDVELFLNTSMPERTQVEERAKEFLRSLDQYPEDLAKGKTNFIYSHYDPLTGSLAVVESPNDANMVEVDFYRPDVEIFPIVSPKYFNSQNYVVMVFHNDEPKVVKAQVKFYKKSEEQVGIYPVKTGDIAWEQLKTGKAIYASWDGNMGDKARISKMFLGYLDPDIYQEYLQPVYVFLGKDNFVAYVPAIDDNYFTK